jgi:predicted Zn finger-like uncharacterized protein
MEDTKMTAIIKIKESCPSFSTKQIGQVFNANFLDESTCRRWILEALHPESSIRCPECGSELSESSHNRFWEGKRVRCSNCGKFFTALTGTALSGCHLDFRSVMLLAVFLYYGFRTDLIANKLDISNETVRLWQKKFIALDKLSNQNSLSEDFL